MPCTACHKKINDFDYKEPRMLRKYVSGSFKVLPAKRTGLCPRHQRKVTNAIKLSRFMALMPFTRSQTRKK
ncbi:MAG: 30S ribosomal protein S18 [Candidatus Yanofskybacteria bacterium CG10_big_fil_rev_8_21_14_0_10_36_16]|uniref:30S ribosomal protein S18 n=1 Tax=Candidatus Yanofskybacteria bacterium CG10_big_fil_rev_8_21_14_0_10_36_16 TaxID=1975096 RepID=A0A2J0Q8F0_9BACT|nr:MAG: 30S ribosomal protein S18 [Candidatus Yanofskybacteria bacterium CG10_big_fil_rev_8_21_14_0_10_36_16]